MSVELHRESLEYVLFPLDTTPVDPTTLTHELAIIDPVVDPVPTDWFNGSYADGMVRALVRASTEAPVGGDVTLAVGRWRVWWRAQGFPEFPTRNVGQVFIR